MILVVVGHCTYYKIVTRYGGIDYDSAMQLAGVADTYAHRFTSHISTIIYTFHMPLFMAISGAVFELGLRRGKYTAACEFLRNKIRRLLVPFLAVTVIYSSPLKYLSGYWDGSSSLFTDIFIGQILVQGNTHLWFLAALFCEFILFWLLVFRGSLGERNAVIVMALLFMLCMPARQIPINIIAYTCEFGIYFYTGMLFEKYRSYLNSRITIKCVFCLLLLWMGLFGGHYLLGHEATTWAKVLKRSDEIAMAFAGMATFYGAIFVALRNNMLKGHWISLLSRDSMGIYLYSDSLNYVILAVFASIFTVVGLGNESLSFGLYIARFVVTFFGGVLVTRVVRFILSFFIMQDISKE